MELIKNNRFSVSFSFLMILIAVISLIADFITSNPNFWFQRSGALIVLAGAELQYSSILSNWAKAKSREKEMLELEAKIAQGNGISMSGIYQELAKTRNFSIEIHELITQKSQKQSVAIFFIVLGTVIWGYGDMPFK
ncbi:hypothetical protein [Photobacterium sp. TLY01]|uniref:hypothetical protein n=1 Tax=Photobacterium sp. TLY01 TaxID=2907534 RepID=UPI001F20BBBB|nr:hypothetical protein [Photobacterium sp. TLY01]UIP30292.1 hypothetical protein LN341_16320 [Photobacterium sp. TLY01]